ncbi:MAG: SLBB domain-containing protein [Spirochaetales bacterium]|nr:SLBB domain-containing protein [Spirochaetales bacterium]
MQKLLRIYVYTWLLILMVILPFFSFAEEEVNMPGFGIQPIRVDTEISEKILIQKTLGNLKYKLTPGDAYKIVIVIDENFTQPLVLDETYNLEIPFLGTMNVKGMYFSDLRQEIIRRIKEKKVVDFVDFILAAPAVFDIFIYGGVENPGYSTVTAINTLWEAIVSAKGFKKGGSYRNISLTRKGITNHYDLVKFIIDGDFTQNPRLEPGDKIYVPHTEIVSEIKGQVLYPEKFELIPGETLFDLLQMAGGYMPDADKSRIEVRRINEDGSVHIEYTEDAMAAQFPLQNGDTVVVNSALENKPMILIEGALNGKPTSGTEPVKIQDKLLVFSMPYIPGSTLLQMLDILGGPSPLADAEESFIIRDKTNERVYVDVRVLWETRNQELDVALEPRDHIVIPMKNIMVLVGGEVHKPGAFPFVNNTIVADYLKLAGGIDFEKADLKGIYFIDDAGNKTKVTLETEVVMGSVIYVDRSVLEKATFVAGKVGIIVGLIASLFVIAVNASDIYANLR